jgi:hypothetical protein
MIPNPSIQPAQPSALRGTYGESSAAQMMPTPGVDASAPAWGGNGFSAGSMGTVRAFKYSSIHFQASMGYVAGMITALYSRKRCQEDEGVASFSASAGAQCSCVQRVCAKCTVPTRKQTVAHVYAARSALPARCCARQRSPEFRVLPCRTTTASPICQVCFVCSTVWPR